MSLKEEIQLLSERLEALETNEVPSDELDLILNDLRLEIDELKAKIPYDPDVDADDDEDSDEEDEEEEYKDESPLDTSLSKSKGIPSPDEDGLIRPSFQFNLSIGKDFNEKKTKAARPSREDDYYPSNEELAMINRLSNVDLSTKDVFSFILRSADMEVDRGFERFNNKSLKQMAEMSIDKPFLMDHSWSTKNIIGKIYDASVKNKGLQQKVYMLNSAENQLFIKNILAGIFNKVSVGFAMNPSEYRCSACNKSMYSTACPHMPGMTDEKGQTVHAVINDVKDYYEVSLVAVPMQPAAGIRRESVPLVDSTMGASKTFNITKGPDLNLWVNLFKKRPSIINPELILKDLSDVLEQPVDRIDNEKSVLGDSVVTDEQKPMDEQPEVVETPTDEVKSVPQESELINSLNETIKSLQESVKSLNEAVAKSSEALVQLSESHKAQGALIEKAMSVSTEELETSILAKLLVNEQPEPVAPQRQGGYLGNVMKALDKSQKEAQ